MPSSTALVSLFAAMVGVPEISEYWELAAVVTPVVNVHVPPLTAVAPRDTVAAYAVDSASTTLGTNETVFVAEEYVEVPATAPPGPVRVTAGVPMVLSADITAVTEVEVGTPTAAGVGVIDTTLTGTGAEVTNVTSTK